MGGQRRKLLKPAAAASAAERGRWVDSFVDYLRSECHLSENTVAAYHRDLRRFYSWLAGRRDRAALDPGSGRLRGLVERAQARSGQHRAAHRVAAHLLPLLATGRAAARQPGRAAGQPEALGARAARAVAQPRSTGCSKVRSPANRCGGAIGPCWNCCTPPAAGPRRSRTCALERRASGPGLLCLSRQRRQGAAGAAGARARFWRCATTWPRSGRRWWTARRDSPSGCCYRGADCGCGASGFGNCSSAMRRAAGISAEMSPHTLAAQLRHALAGWRRRSPPGAGDAGARQHRHDANLHARRSGAAEGGPQAVSSSRMNTVAVAAPEPVSPASWGAKT